MAGEDSPLGEAHALLVDEAMAMDRNPAPETYEIFRKSALASRLAVEAPMSSRGVASTKLLEVSAGKYPEAFLVIRKGPGIGQRHLLKAECVIGDVELIYEEK